MTLTELSYMMLEILREGHVVDDERLDHRLIKDWIGLKRTKFIEQRLSKNPNARFSLNTYQKIPLTLVLEDVIDAGDYPYIDDTVQDYQYHETIEDIPNIMEGKEGPLIYSVESQDVIKLPFTVVDYDHLRLAGNGKFNSTIIFCAFRDNKLYFKYNENMVTYPDIILRALFENPSDVPGYDDDTSEYPVDASMLDDMKKYIIQEDLNSFLKGVSDEINDASGEINP